MNLKVNMATLSCRQGQESADRDAMLMMVEYQRAGDEMAAVIASKHVPNSIKDAIIEGIQGTLSGTAGEMLDWSKAQTIRLLFPPLKFAADSGLLLRRE